VETARSYKSCKAANAYSSRGYKGACERSNENKCVEGMMHVFGEMPYTASRLTAVIMVAKEGELWTHDIS